ncbi:hypothetical protein Tco_1501353 [Tanacetum coccineum]
MRDPLSLVFNTLLLFSSKNEDKVFNPSSLSSNEEKSPHPLSHRGLRAFNESPMMISGEDTLNLDVSPNGDALRKCILKGPYTPTIVTTPAVPATEDSLAVPEQTTVETAMNMTPENRAHFESEKEAIHLILTGIGDEIYSTVDACQTAQEMGTAIERYNKASADLLNIRKTEATSTNKWVAMERRLWLLKIQLKAWWQQTLNDDIDLENGIIDSEPMHFGQDGLGDFDWSNTDITDDHTSLSIDLIGYKTQSGYLTASKWYSKTVMTGVPKESNSLKIEDKNNCLILKNSKKWLLWLLEYDPKGGENSSVARKESTSEICIAPGLLSKNVVLAERSRIWTLIEAARTMIADSYLPINLDLLTSVALRPFRCSSGTTKTSYLDQLRKLMASQIVSYLLGILLRGASFRENQKGKGTDWMFNLELLTPSMNYIPVRKKNYANSGEKVSTLDDVEDLDDQQFIVHTAQTINSEERTVAKEVPLSPEEQALHDELMSLMHQESLAKAHNDAQRISFEEEKRRIFLAKGKESVNSTLTLSTANTPSQSTALDVHQKCILYGNITEEVYVKQPPGFEDPAHPTGLYRVVKRHLGLHQAHEMDVEETMKKGIQMSSMGELTFFLGVYLRSTSGGYQISWRGLSLAMQKKLILVAYIIYRGPNMLAAASCCAQVLWMQNQLLDYGFNFMNTKIHIDNESTICIVRNPVFHSKTKHIQIRHHFIRDCYEQRLINVVKVHTDDNVKDLLTKGFDLARFNFLVVTVGMMNP